MEERFESKYQQIAEEMKNQPWMQVVPRMPELKQEWNVDRWVAGSFSTYAVERMNGKSIDEAMAYTAKANQRANLENPPAMEEKKPFADTPEAKAHFERLAAS